MQRQVKIPSDHYSKMMLDELFDLYEEILNERITKAYNKIKKRIIKAYNKKVK